jgi:hypothetical protein
LHAPSVHVPVAQLAAAFAKLHVVPQLAQFVSELSCTSQPSLATPLQLP